jgi:hypothetical protein
MEPVLLLATLALSLGISLAIARVFLGCVFHVMTHGRLPFVFYWRRVIFATALFWLWYLTPMVASSRAAASVMRFLIP